MAEAETHARACRKLCVAAVQMASVLGEVETNLQAAERWIAAAAARGAELVLLPDCFACGYCLSSAAWKFAEPLDGKTRTKMRAVAAKHKVFVGYTFLEATANGDVRNTFLLTSPEGVEWQCSKTEAVALEAFCFKPAPFHSILRTPIGTIGVQICYESFSKRHQQDICQHVRHSQDGNFELDLLLSPFSACCPDPGFCWSKQEAKDFENIISSSGRRLASMFTVPVVMANMVGRMARGDKCPRGGLFSLGTNTGEFVGQSCVCSGSGQVLASVEGRNEGIAVAHVQLGPHSPTSTKHAHCASALSRVMFRVQYCGPHRHIAATPRTPPFTWTFVPLKMEWIMQQLGALAYTMSVSRRRAVAEACGQPSALLFVGDMALRCGSGAALMGFAGVVVAKCLRLRL